MIRLILKKKKKADNEHSDDNIQQNILDVNRTWQDGLVLNETRARTVKKKKWRRKKKKSTKKQETKVKIKMIQQLTINKNNNKNIGA